jgi:hypothetical protein
LISALSQRFVDADEAHTYLSELQLFYLQ